MPEATQDHSGVLMPVPASLSGGGHQTLDLTLGQIFAGTVTAPPRTGEKTAVGVMPLIASFSTIAPRDGKRLANYRLCSPQLSEDKETERSRDFQRQASDFFAGFSGNGT
jgi:hypothetical protein